MIAVYRNTEPYLPLADLAERLTVAPPSIGALLQLLEDSEYVREFLNLVREYLPENEQEIMVGDEEHRVETFIRLFSNRYFPIEEPAFAESPMAEMVYLIPINLAGFNLEDYHEFQSYRPGHILIQSLVSYPYADMDDEERGLRASIMDEVATMVGKELANRVPEKGWEPNQLHEMLDGTNFQGIADFADWMWHQTDTFVLDCSYEEWMPEQWSRQLVDELTEQHPRAEAIMDRMAAMFDWLEANQQQNYAALLDFLEGKERNQVAKEQMALPGLENREQQQPKTLMEVFSEGEVYGHQSSG